jgi:hypothetical protein
MLNVPAACLVPYGNPTRDCSRNRFAGWFLGLSSG